MYNTSKKIKTRFFWLLLLSIVGIIQAQESDESFEFELLRQNDNVSFLKEKEDKSFYDQLKYTKLSENSYLSFGGSYRGQYEYFNNESFEPNETDGWILNRLQLHTDFRWKDKLQVYAELNSSSVWSKENPNPVERDELAISQLFINYNVDKFSILIGRESPNYGSRRLIALREGPNVRRYFDNVKLKYHANRIDFEAFLSYPVQTRPFGFDNKALDSREVIWGSYNTLKLENDIYNLDFYYLGQDRDFAIYQQGLAEEIRHSIGTRHSGSYEDVLYDVELIYQFGDFGNNSISAWTVSLKTIYEFDLLGLGAEVGLKSEFISGDKNASDNRLNTFNALYPRGAYFGRVAQFGPANLFDIHPEFGIKFDNFKLELDYVAFWRASIEDGIYGASLNLDFESLNDEKFIGHQYGAVLNYEPSPFIVLEAETNIITPGEFLKQNELENTLFHFVFTAEFKF